MRQIKLDYVPTPKQAFAHASNADEMLYGGGAGGGKSKFAVMDAFNRCIRYPKTHAYLFRRSYPELRDTLIAEAQRSIPRELGTYIERDKAVRLINGSEMRFRHCQSEVDLPIYQGAEIHWLYIDELTHFTKYMYDYLKTRLRAVKELGIKPVVRCTSNPDGVGHAWVKEHFVTHLTPYEVQEFLVKNEITGEEQLRTKQFIPALVRDNPYLSENYIFELLQKPQKLRRALLEGDWNVFEGQVFEEWRNEPAHYDDRRWTHVIKPFPIPEHWKRYKSFDFGYSRPYCVQWWAVDPDGIVYLYRELYGISERNGMIQPDVGVREDPRTIAAKIREIEKQNNEQNIFGFADPSIWDGSRGEAIIDQMGYMFDKGENARVAGKMQLHWRLQFDEDGIPRMYVFNTCRHFIRTLPSLVYDPTNPEDVDTRGEDHAYDAARYFLMSRPVKPLAQVRPPHRKLGPLDSFRQPTVGGFLAK